MNNTLNFIIQYIKDRFNGTDIWKEPSTYGSIAAILAGLLSVQFTPQFIQAFEVLGVAVFGLIGVILKEGITKK